MEDLRTAVVDNVKMTSRALTTYRKALRGKALGFPMCQTIDCDDSSESYQTLESLIDAAHAFGGSVIRLGANTEAVTRKSIGSGHFLFILH